MPQSTMMMIYMGCPAGILICILAVLLYMNVEYHLWMPYLCPRSLLHVPSIFCNLWIPCTRFLSPFLYFNVMMHHICNLFSFSCAVFTECNKQHIILLNTYTRRKTLLNKIACVRLSKICKNECLAHISSKSLISKIFPPSLSLGGLLPSLSLRCTKLLSYIFVHEHL